MLISASGDLHHQSFGLGKVVLVEKELLDHEIPHATGYLRSLIFIGNMKVIAAVSVSGPLERLSRQPGRMHAPAVLAAAERLSESLRRAAAE